MTTSEGDTSLGSRSYLDRLTAAVQRLAATAAVSAELRTMADEAPTITPEQLAERLRTLANRLRALPGASMVLVRFPLDQVIHLDAMVTVDTTLWRCRICEREGRARTTPEAMSDALAHLGFDHGGEANPQ